ncbi:ribonuclease H-like protein [Gloeophyllum trabeum ATCC 11539]|uniref:Ribonuclease H-like protein n=1 Tax=Gloeophyllum trabeum (strain ATCC 11539 / FP-39264 / Madison 617) TaxID=670483 RepID=S7RQ99_GLOTA|nr:ribonuclease H-like protein [Gloeophyllum trabeum ATCC 11539]EPQ55069.1 ribonuclease H-like protein [Gloeophyllum trabeum ATCC 11539]
MTGLNYKRDKIMEIAVLITNGDLEIIDEGLEYVVRVDESILNKMDEWCTKQHGLSGLTQASLNSPNSIDFVAGRVLEYIKRWVPEPRTAVLAGNSVHADRAFLLEEMPEVVDYLHYRIELCRRWYPSLPRPDLHIQSKHRALDDIKGSIKELRYYRDNVFVPPESRR